MATWLSAKRTVAVACGCAAVMVTLGMAAAETRRYVPNRYAPTYDPRAQTEQSIRREYNDRTLRNSQRPAQPQSAPETPTQGRIIPRNRE